MSYELNFEAEPFRGHAGFAASRLFGGGAVAPQGELELEIKFSFDDFPSNVLGALNAGREAEAVRLSISPSLRDGNKLTDLVFHKRHPERNLHPLRRGEAAGAAEWTKIRDTLVRPPLFFAEYDFRFLPGDPVLGLPANNKMSPPEKSLRVADLVLVSDLLTERAINRFDEAKKGLAFVGRPTSLALRPRVVRLSWAQVQLIREFFGTPNGGFDWPAFQRAFEQFANGELRNPARGQGAGEPDGARQFFFAEFALLCIEFDVHKAFWGKAVTSLIKTQEIFVNVYQPDPRMPSTPPPPPTSGPDRAILERYVFGNFKATRQFDGTKKQQLRAKYDPLTLNELRSAMGANMRLADQFNSR